MLEIYECSKLGRDTLHLIVSEGCVNIKRCFNVAVTLLFLQFFGAI